MAFYAKSVAYTRAFKMIDSADHISKKTGLTCTVNISKSGAAFAAAAGAVSEVANGWYKVALTTADTNTGGDLAFYITASGADDTDFVDQIFDGLVSVIGVNVVNWNGTVVATPATAGVPDVNAKNINNVATSSVTTINANVGTTQPENFTGTGASALVKTDVIDWRSTAIGVLTNPGIPEVDMVRVLGTTVSATAAQIGTNVVNWNNTVVATPATAGVPDVNAKNINNVAASSVTTISANVGTTQPQNFTGTGASALVKTDVIDWRSTAIGVLTNPGIPEVDMVRILGTTSPAAAGLVRADAVTGSVGSVTGLTASNLDATISSRLAAASYTAPDNSSITAIKAKTDLIVQGLQKNVAFANFHIFMVSAVDHVSGATGISILGFRVRAGTDSNFVALDNAVTEIGFGLYKVDLTANDLNADIITLGFRANPVGVGADTRTITIVTKP